jgi:hypothetical protein
MKNYNDSHREEIKAVDASVDAYRRGEEGKKGFKAIGRLWAKLWTIV